MRFEIRALADDDREWARDVLQEHWGSAEIVSRGRVPTRDEIELALALAP